MFETWLEAGGRGQDRLLVEVRTDRVVIAVTDGAGGIGGGAAAAEAVIEAIQIAAHRPLHHRCDWMDVLRTVDLSLARSDHGGQTTAVVVEVRTGALSGASVGDSAAWHIASHEVEDLTGLQQRRPLIGSGQAVPVAFGPSNFSGRLLVATDGLVSYVKPEAVERAVRLLPLQLAISALVDGARLLDGTLPDDVAVVLFDANDGLKVEPGSTDMLDPRSLR